ncbi:hypothetical protein [Sphingobium sp.]|uniref:hypothetical protein n=1 Tax=Sphingobium sp. TaxID=1912891 RepID=UPI00257C318D|nr:hypothetical protein [Sphingobium sp.]
MCANIFMVVAEAVRFAKAHGVDATLIPAALAGGLGAADSAVYMRLFDLDGERSA